MKLSLVFTLHPKLKMDPPNGLFWDPCQIVVYVCKVHGSLVFLGCFLLRVDGNQLFVDVLDVAQCAANATLCLLQE